MIVSLDEKDDVLVKSPRGQDIILFIHASNKNVREDVWDFTQLKVHMLSKGA